MIRLKVWLYVKSFSYLLVVEAISFLWQCRYLVCHLWKASPQTLSYSQRRPLISVWFKDVTMCLIAVHELLNQSVDRSFTMTLSSKPDTSAQHNHVQEYAREVLSMGLLYIDGVCWLNPRGRWAENHPLLEDVPPNFKATIGRTIPSRRSPCLLNMILFLCWGWSNSWCGKEHSMWLIQWAPEPWVCVH